MQRDLTRWALRHPTTSGLLFAAVGIAMIADARAEGERLERFLDARPVDATVAKTYNAVDRSWFPDYKAVIAWREGRPEAELRDDNGDFERRETIDIYLAEYEGLEPGDTLSVLVSREESGGALLESRFRNGGIVHVLGLTFSYMGIVGAIMMAFGLGLYAWGVVRRSIAREGEA